MLEKIPNRMENTRTIESYGYGVFVNNRDSTGNEHGFMEPARATSSAKKAAPPFPRSSFSHCLVRDPATPRVLGFSL